MHVRPCVLGGGGKGSQQHLTSPANAGSPGEGVLSLFGALLSGAQKTDELKRWTCVILITLSGLRHACFGQGIFQAASVIMVPAVPLRGRA
jgi:hypothetical protein